MANETDSGVIDLAGMPAMTIDSAASALGASRRTVYRLIRQGELGSFLHAGRTYIAVEELEGYFARLRDTASVSRVHRAKLRREEAIRRARVELEIAENLPA